MEQPAGLGLFTTDRELVVRSWNAWLAAATGFSETRVEGQALLDLIPADRRELWRETFTEVLERGTTRVLAPAFHHYVFTCPPTLPSRFFDQMQQRVTVAPLLAGDAISGVIVTVEDVTAVLDEQRVVAARLREGAAPDEALAAVGAHDWRVRRAAVRTLKQSASKEDIAHLLASLEQQHQNLDVLNSALRVLVAADRDVVAPLIALLGDPHPNLRMHAALALGELGDMDAVPALIGALGDEDANVRFHTIEALGRLAAPAAVEPLAQIAATGDFFLSFPAIDALSRTDDPRVVPTLLTLLGNDLLRPAVIDTLAVLGDEECVAPLAALINNGQNVAAAAAALVQVRGRYDDTYAAGDQIVDLARGALSRGALDPLTAAIEQREAPLTAVITLLGWIGGEAAPVLATLVGHPEGHTSAAAALTLLKRDAVPVLIERIGQADRTARIAVVALLGQLGDRRAVPALIELLAAADAELVATATAALAELGDARALDEVLALFRHEQPAVRQAAIAAVNTLGTGLTEARVRTQLTDADPRVRECAVRVAGYFGFDTCVPAIFERLSDDSEDVRRAAIEQLPVLDRPEAAARLVAALQKETGRNRAAAAHAARGMEGPAVDGPLREALTDADPWVRYFAIDSLSRHGDAAAAARLRAMAAGDPAPQVRIAAVAALGALDPDAAVAMADGLLDGPEDDAICAVLTTIAPVHDARVDRLFERALHSPHASVRHAAVDGLARRRSTEAVGLLAWSARMTDSPAQASATLEALTAIARANAGAASDSAVAALLEVGTDPSRRADVVALLARLGSSAVPAIARALADPRIGTRLAAVESLARMRQPEASAALSAALGDADASVRGAAITGFGRLGTPAVASAIARLRDRDPDAGVRARAALVCDRYGWQP